MTEQKEFMTRMFLIDSDIPESKWKITGEQKMILDFPCMEATRTDTSGVITRAWFTPSIPVRSGPAKYHNLPGLILEVDINNSERTITAKSVSLDPPEKSLLKKPRDGKKVTREEYDKIVAEKMKEMGVEGGEGEVRSSVVIRIKH
jgi:GLPGLI family protein